MTIRNALWTMRLLYSLKFFLNLFKIVAKLTEVTENKKILVLYCFISIIDGGGAVWSDMQTTNDPWVWERGTPILEGGRELPCD